MTAFKCSFDDSTLYVELGADLADIDRTVETVEREIAERFPGLGRFGLLLGLREALTNAVLHGNRLDPSKTVRCKVNFGYDRMTVEVSDEGEGFDWKNIPTALPDPTSPGHRGIAIMSVFYDERIYNAKGNAVLLTKRFPS